MIHLSTEQRLSVAGLARKHRVVRLELFGSATTERFDPERSDVDLLVTFHPMPPREHANCFFGLADDLEALLGQRVDLVETEAVQNSYFLRAIAGSRIPLYAA